MSITFKYIGLFWLLVLTAGCHVFSGGAHNEVEGRSAAKLVINGSLLLPLPAQYEELGPGESSFIVRKTSSSIGYRWIDGDEITFIGADKTPYEFFSSAFDGSSVDEEARFIEGLGAERITHIERDGLEFHHASLKRNEKLYVMAERLPFVVEVTMDKDSVNYIDLIIKSASLR